MYRGHHVSQVPGRVRMRQRHSKGVLHGEFDFTKEVSLNGAPETRNQENSKKDWSHGKT